MTKHIIGKMRKKTNFEFVSTYAKAKRMSAHAFEKHYQSLIKDPLTLHFQVSLGAFPSFFPIGHPLDLLLKDLLSKNAELNDLMQKLPERSLRPLVEKARRDELLATLALDGVKISEEDAFLSVHAGALLPSNDLNSLSFCYALMDDGVGYPLATLEDLRKLYDLSFRGALSKNERVDSDLFRQRALKSKEPTLQGEDIKYALKEALSILAMENLNVFAKLALFDFFLRYAHPFYRGNGRFARLEESFYLSEHISPYFCFFLSQGLQAGSSELLRAYALTFAPLNRGDMSAYANAYLSLLSKEYDRVIFDLRRKKEVAKHCIAQNLSCSLDKELSEYLAYASVYEGFGLSVYDMASFLEVSERSIIRFLSPLKEKGLLKIRTMGKTVYYSFKE